MPLNGSELVPVKGGDPIPLLRPKLVIGRRESCDICLRFPNVSGRHCELTFQDGYWTIRDLGSTNSMRINDRSRQPKEPASGRPSDHRQPRLHHRVFGRRHEYPQRAHGRQHHGPAAFGKGRTDPPPARTGRNTANKSSLALRVGVTSFPGSGQALAWERMSCRLCLPYLKAAGQSPWRQVVPQAEPGNESRVSDRLHEISSTTRLTNTRSFCSALAAVARMSWSTTGSKASGRQISVTTERPRLRSPQWTPTITSGTVDMPTTSAPMRAEEAIFGAGLEIGPGHRDVHALVAGYPLL